MSVKPVRQSRWALAESCFLASVDKDLTSEYEKQEIQS